MKRGLLPYVMITITTVFGLVNFFAPFFTNFSYKTDPVVTYFFLGFAASIAGYKGFNLGTVFRRFGPTSEKPKKEVE